MSKSKMDLIAQLHERLVSKRNFRHMRWFNTDAKMELLYVVYLFQGTPSFGLTDYINAISTAPQSNANMTVFIRNMIEVGAFDVCGTDKKSRKHLFVSSSAQT